MPAALTLTLAPNASSPAVARQDARRRFADKLAPRRMDELELVLTELVTNAVKYGTGDVVVRLQLDGEVIRGEVVDQGGGFEHEVRERGPNDVAGRGLLIVDTVADSWGVHEGTTHVWFELKGASPTPKHPGSDLEPELGEDKRPDELGEDTGS